MLVVCDVAFLYIIGGLFNHVSFFFCFILCLPKWKLSHDLLCEEDSRVKDRQDSCCLKTGSERLNCFSEAAENPNYQPTVEIPVTSLPPTSSFSFNPSICQRFVDNQISGSVMVLGNISALNLYFYDSSINAAKYIDIFTLRWSFFFPEIFLLVSLKSSSSHIENVWRILKCKLCQQ